jgi:hypothetical protein
LMLLCRGENEASMVGRAAAWAGSVRLSAVRVICR